MFLREWSSIIEERAKTFCAPIWEGPKFFGPTLRGGSQIFWRVKFERKSKKGLQRRFELVLWLYRIVTALKLKFAIASVSLIKRFVYFISYDKSFSINYF